MKYWLKKFIAQNRKRFYYKILLTFSIFLFLILDYIPLGYKPLSVQFNSPLISRLVMAAEPIQAIPEKVNLDIDKVELGNKLFHDKKLSSGDTLSCASCHNLSAAGTDRLVHSFGFMGEGEVNSPTVYNSGLSFRQFWDGRATDLEDQIEGPVTSTMEMGANWDEIVAKLQQDSQYSSLFKKVYQDQIKVSYIKNAIAEFEKSLITPNSRFDRYLKGEQNAITTEEKEGYSKFKAYGCASCHQGVLVGGNMFQSFGIMGDYFATRGNIKKSDLGRYNVTGKESDRYVFKVPSLRNIALTPPYFHDGSTATLAEAVKIMGKYQLGRDLSTEDINSIVRFLNTLTGEYKNNPL